MDLSRFERWLLPADMESNPRFQGELFGLSRTGLRMLGAMELAITVFLLPTGGVTWHFASVWIVGLLTIGFAAAKGARRHVRTVALLSGWLSAAALTETALWITPQSQVDDHLLFGELALLLFAVISAVPMIPLQTCVFGSLIGVLYGVTAPFAGAWDGSLQIFIVFLTCFATGVSALLYAQKRAAFEEHQRSLEFQETLTTAQSRAQLAETAMSLGRLAAALTHEINTPLGALRSAVDTMLLLTRRQAEGKAEDRERLAIAHADLTRSITESAQRLSQVVTRLKRLVALERDEKLSVNINDLLTDAGLMVEEKLGAGVRVNWQLKEIPPVACSTNQLTTVFANLLANAVSAVDGAGEITVSTGAENGLVEVTVRDNGRGMEAEDVSTIFDPGFKVHQGRVLGGNWSLFTARQIVNEHGGEIWIESRPGEGTAAHVSLPAAR